MLLRALRMSLIGFGVKAAVACNLYSDCSFGCETNPDTSLLECAELDGVGGFIFATRPIATAESMAGVGAPCPQSNTTRYCYCNLDIRGGTCMYGNRGIPATDLPTLKPSSSPSMLPSSSQSPSVSAKPSISGRPSVSASPSTPHSPSASVAPSTTVWPTTSLRPSKSAQPSISAEPSISTSPSVSSNPSSSAQPSVSLAQSSTGWPTISAHEHPSVSSSLTDEPSSSVEPSISSAPSTTTSPSVSSQPSATSTPSTREWPANSSHPSVSSEEPSLSTTPSTSKGPSVSARPSVSAQPSISSAPSATTRPTKFLSVSAKPTSMPTPSPMTTELPSLGIEPNLPAECAGKCPNKEIDPVLGRHDCGWGIWNDCTCQCVCDPGVCLSANSKCYDGCTTHLDFNPYGGCIPGVDCPWYRSKHGEPHCESSTNFAGVHGLRETAELCCKFHFSYVNLATCVQNSKADVIAEEAKVAQDLARSKYHYPDMHGKQNCVFDSGYQDWMAGPNKEHFLFESSAQCCGNWYPSKTDCPDTTTPVTPKQLDYKPDASEGYFYPHLSESNCRYGRNYPMWMKISPKHYLYTTPEECCRTWYPSELNCPLKEDDGVQEGLFWIVDTAYYPNWKGDGCALGNDYPKWMADPTQRDTHLFESAKQCCDLWFRSTSTECQQTIVVTSAGKQVSGPPNNNGGTWYPSLNGKYLCINGTPSKWMEAEGYKDEYVFKSHAECCKAHYCQDIRGTVQS